MPQKRKTCPTCYGSGTEQDLVMSVALGTALGGGYLPMTKPCHTCYGAGTVEDR